MKNVTHDIIIIGGGPAGLTAGIYAARERLNTLLLEKGVCGGLPAITDLIENYPGFPEGIKGMDLMKKFKKQAEKFGVRINELEGVKKIEPLGEKIKVQTDKQEHTACAVIVASGSLPRKLGILGEDEFLGKGVSYCATCDGPLYRDKDVAVVGGGDAALQEALFLTQFAKTVFLIHRRNEFRGAAIYQERLRKNEKIEFLLGYILTSINGDTQVSSITVKNRETGEEKQVEVSGIFIYAGFLPNTKFLEGIVEFDDSAYIITNEKMETSVPGVYAAGDVRSKKVRQIDAACGDATVAAVSAGEYITELK